MLKSEEKIANKQTDCVRCSDKKPQAGYSFLSK